MIASLKSRFAIASLFMLGAFLLVGCESIQEIDRAAGELAKEMKARRAAQEAQQRRSGEIVAVRRRCERSSGSLTVPGLDPDLAYLRLKRYFGYNTPEEARHAYPNPDWLADTQYLHDALPGVRYEMREEVTWPSSVYGPVHVWLNLTIEKTGHGAHIAWNHCRGTDGWQRLGDPDAADRHLREDIARIARGK